MSPVQRNRTAYLHIGPAKTGSTQLQYFCNDNRVDLGRAGLLYPLDHWHAKLGSYASPDPLKYSYNKLSGRTDLEIINSQDSAFVSQLSQEIEMSDARAVILSYEGFFDLTKEAIRGLSEYLKARSLQTQVVFYCRSPMAIAVSNISQAAKSGMKTPLDQTGENLNLPVVGYATQVPKFIEVFGRENIIARRFDKNGLVAGSILHDFFDVMGLDFESLFGNRQSARLNTALSHNGIRIAIMIRDMTQGKYNSWSFETWFGRFLNQVQGPPLELSSDQISWLERSTKEHTQYIAKEFGIDLRAPKLADHEAATTPSVRAVYSKEAEEIARRVIEVQMKAEKERGSQGHYWPWLHSEYARLADELNAQLADA